RGFHAFLTDLNVAGSMEHLVNVAEHDEGQFEAFENYYSKIDPRIPLIAAAPAGTSTQCTAMFDEDFVRHNELFQDFAIPHGIRYTLCAKPVQWDSMIVLTAVGRHHEHGDYSPGELATFSSVMRHFGRALQIRRRIEGLNEESLLREQA